jgi:hypothetical protein
MKTLTRKLALTAAVALYVLAALCGLLVLATLLPGLWAVVVLPAGLLNGWIASDMLGAVWGLEDQFDHGETE